MAENPGIKEGDRIYVDGREVFALALAKSGLFWGKLDCGLVNTLWTGGPKFSYWGSIQYRRIDNTFSLSRRY